MTQSPSSRRLTPTTPCVRQFNEKGQELLNAAGFVVREKFRGDDDQGEAFWEVVQRHHKDKQ